MHKRTIEACLKCSWRLWKTVSMDLEVFVGETIYLLNFSQVLHLPGLGFVWANGEGNIRREKGKEKKEIWFLWVFGCKIVMGHREFWVGGNVLGWMLGSETGSLPYPSLCLPTFLDAKAERSSQKLLSTFLKLLNRWQHWQLFLSLYSSQVVSYYE